MTIDIDQEKTTAELKSGLAYDEIPTADLKANTAWQKLNLLTHNLQTSFQIEVLTEAKRPTWKRTTAFLIRSVRTLRFQFINRAGRIVNVSGSRCLRLQNDQPAEAVHRRIEQILPMAA